MPRTLAADIMEDIIIRKIPFETSFSKGLKVRKLSRRDRAFCFNLVLTTLRRGGQIDNLIATYLDRPLGTKGERAMILLRLGVAQIIFMAIKPYAAVDTSVRLAESRKLGHYKKLINAILRKLAKEGLALAEKQEAEKLNTPEWLWKSWEKAYGATNCYNMAKVHQTQPPLDITVKKDPEGWAKKLSGTNIFGNTVRLNENRHIEGLPGYSEGDWWVQDLAATIPVMLFGNVQNSGIADLCAAPGGKTAQLLSMGAKVFAVDLSHRRVGILDQNMKRLNFQPKIVVEDACKWKPKNLLDAVLIDAPCSSTGTLRRNPDIFYTKTKRDIEKLTGIQLTLLKAAKSMVKKGGIIVFSTCSLLPQEGEDLIDSVLVEDKTLSRAPISAEELGLMPELVTKVGDLRTLPVHYSNLGGMDGFYAARLIRN